LHIDGDLLSYDVLNGNGQASGISPAYGEIRRVALIYGRINHIALGSVIAIAKDYVDSIYVLYDGYDNRIEQITRSLGAELIKDPALQDIVDDNAMVAMLNGDGSQDPRKIPMLFEQLRGGYDLITSSSLTDRRHISESVLFLNNKTLESKFTGLIACKYGLFLRFRRDRAARGRVDMPGQLYDFARSKGLKVKNLGDESFGTLFSYNIGVVVPAYNEERLLGETIRGIPDYVTRIYIIDDGSTDGTPKLIKAMRDPRIRAVRHEANKGVGAAIITGYKMALEDEMDIVAVMAGDNQMDPLQLPRLLMPIIEDKADYTKGNRLISRDFRTGMSTWRTVGNSLLTMITKVGSGYWDIMDPQNGYTAISRKALEAINLDSIYTYYGYCNDMLIKLNAFGMRTVDVVMPARYGSERSHIKYGRYILKVAPMIFRGFLWRLKTKYIILNFHPLVFFYCASMIMVPFGVLFSIWIAIKNSLNQHVSTNYPLLAAFITLMGVQLLLFAMLFDMQEDRRRSEAGSL
jgi:glycosyltransferase involved in cell wall biosynthesis